MFLRDVTEIQLLAQERQKVKMLEFLNASVSHDMVAPISNILMFVSELHRMGVSGDIAKMDYYHQLSINSAQLLQCRVKDLLDRNLIENKAFQPREVEFSPRAIVDQMVAIFDPRLLGMNVMFETDHS